MTSKMELLENYTHLVEIREVNGNIEIVKVDPFRTISTISMKLQLQILCMSKTTADKRILSRTFRLPEHTISCVLELEDDIIQYWKDRNQSNIHLQNIVAINRLLIEWLLRVVAAKQSVKFSVFKQQARSMKKLFNEPFFQLPRVWWSNFKATLCSEKYYIVGDPDYDSLDIEDILHDLKQKLCKATVQRFLRFIAQQKRLQAHRYVERYVLVGNMKQMASGQDIVLEPVVEPCVGVCEEDDEYSESDDDMANWDTENVLTDSNLTANDSLGPYAQDDIQPKSSALSDLEDDYNSILSLYSYDDYNPDDYNIEPKVETSNAVASDTQDEMTDTGLLDDPVILVETLYETDSNNVDYKMDIKRDFKLAPVKIEIGDAIYVITPPAGAGGDKHPNEGAVSLLKYINDSKLNNAEDPKTMAVQKDPGSGAQQFTEDGNRGKETKIILNLNLPNPKRSDDNCVHYKLLKKPKVWRGN